MKKRKADESKAYLARVLTFEEARQEEGLAAPGSIVTFEKAMELARLKGSPRTQASTAKPPLSTRRQRGTTVAQPGKKSQVRLGKK